MSRTTTKIIIAQEDGTVVGQYFLGDGEHLIGRETHCTIQLEATHVSREHAKLIISADAIEIEAVSPFSPARSCGSAISILILKDKASAGWLKVPVWEIAVSP
jgi:hypothetical protein